jgi:hypothetical protein
MASRTRFAKYARKTSPPNDDFISLFPNDRKVYLSVFEVGLITC